MIVEDGRKKRLRNLTRAGKGRKKGAKNKVTKTVKQALEESLNSGDGAVAFFEQLKDNDPKTYSNVIAKLLPVQIKQELDAKHEHSGKIEIELVPFESEQEGADQKSGEGKG